MRRCDVEYMIDDRSHTYLIKWLPHVILRRARPASRDTPSVIFFVVINTENSTAGIYTKGGIRKREKKGKLRKIQIKKRFIDLNKSLLFMASLYSTFFNSDI